MANLNKAIEFVQSRREYNSGEGGKNVRSCLKAYERDKKRLDWLLADYSRASFEGRGAIDYVMKSEK